MVVVGPRYRTATVAARKWKLPLRAACNVDVMLCCNLVIPQSVQPCMVLVVIEQEGDLGRSTSSSASSFYQQTYGPQLVKISFIFVDKTLTHFLSISLSRSLVFGQGTRLHTETATFFHQNGHLTQNKSDVSLLHLQSESLSFSRNMKDPEEP